MAAVERLNLERECTQLQSANQDLRLKLTQTQRHAEEVSSENHGLKRKFQAHEDETNRMKKEQKELRNFYEQRLIEADAERDNLRNMLEEKRRELQNTERQVHGSTESSVFGRYEEEHRKVVNERNGLKALVKRLESESVAKDARFNKLRSDNQELRTQLDGLNAEAPMRTEVKCTG
ncbi:hypothetical protein BJV82DRAFT_66338 [Fennellomyces sp. T-0311]|nr:hypothetical protein BJV82DRAFT_66338 [Fennellomyces sp. T-0311]